jgi:methylthioribose-1-phosphate isomerase
MTVSHPVAVRWSEDGPAVELLDQTRLPGKVVQLRLDSAAGVAEAIRSLRVRGAPAIGIAAAMGLAVEVAAGAGGDAAALRRRLDAGHELLRRSRPTAVNLFWALERVRLRALDALGESVAAAVSAAAAEARAIAEEDRAMCLRIGENGLSLLPEGEVRALTHCNAGALATGGIGTALAPLYLAHDAGRRVRVFADETRPVLQGSRLTAWELGRAGVDVTLLVDGAAAFLLQQRQVDLVIVGADRIAANGDVANKIGTYGLAVLARHHDIPFYVAAPASTVDLATASGSAIPIEERDAEEIRRGFGRLTAPADVAVYAPAFDVTPAALITAIITDRGVVRPPYGPGLAGFAHASPQAGEPAGVEGASDERDAQ